LIFFINMVYFKTQIKRKKEVNTKKVKEWLTGIASIGIPITVILLVIYVIKLATGKNIISGLSDIMGPVEEKWINGIAEWTEAVLSESNS